MLCGRNYHLFLIIQHPHNYNLCTLVSKTMSDIKSFVFLDLETTGLPHLEHNLTKITEFCAVSVQANHIELGCFPRVNNKLSFCFNPNKLISPESTKITGLSNALLENQSNFSFDVVETIKKWLACNPKPVCLVAHNGNRFDFPILRAEIDKTGNSLDEDLLCLDSLTAFKYLDKIQNVPKKESVPLDFDDGFDEILMQAAEEYDREVEERIYTPEEVQKNNETTPKKQVMSAQSTRNRYTGIITNKRHFGHIKQFTSYKLGDVYSRLTNKEPCNVHEAEGDVTMLITCAAVYGEKFIAYAKESAMKFLDVPIMKPGRKIGT